MEDPFNEKYYKTEREAVKVSKRAKAIESRENYFDALDPTLERKYQLKSTSALTCGIISIVTCTFWYLFIPAGIIAIIFGHHGYAKAGYKTAKAGFILGIIGLSLGVMVHIPLIGLLLNEL